MSTDAQAAIQRLRQIQAQYDRYYPGHSTIPVPPADLQAALDALDALGAAMERARALEYAATWVNEEFDDEHGPAARTFEQRAALDYLYITLSGQDDMTAQQPPAASPAATGATEGGA